MARRRDEAKSGRRSAGAAGGALLLVLLAFQSSQLPAQSLSLHRLTVSTPAAVDSIRRLGIDVVEARPGDGGAVDLVMVLAPRDEDLLLARGHRPIPVPRPPLVAAMEDRRRLLGAGAFTVFRDFDDPARGVRAWLTAFAAARANVAVESIGASVEGRPILAVKIGPAGDGPSRPNVLFMATYHAREWAATEMALRLIGWLADSLPLQPGGAQLLGQRDVWVIPVVNPDGYQYTFTTQRLWRRNRRPNGDGTFGVDLNRNHAAWFALDNLGSSGSTASEVYRGPFAESEPEVAAVARFHSAHPPVASISYHSYAGAVLYAWGHAGGLLAGDDPVHRRLAGSDLHPAVRDSVPGSRNSYYHPGPGWHLYPTNGDYVSWAHRAHGTAAFTVELTSGCCIAGQSYGFEFPDDEALLDRVFRDNLPMALALIRSADNPALAPGYDNQPPPLRISAEFESVWPEARVLAPADLAAPALEMASGSGLVRAVPIVRDSLGAGRYYVRYRSGTRATTDALALRFGALTAEVLWRDGAEQGGTTGLSAGWSGEWARTGTEAFEGSWSWTAQSGMLISPALAAGGRSDLTLFFWTKFSGSLFAQERRGRVEVSADGGPWTAVHELAGAATEWVPVAVPLRIGAAATLRVRFVAENLGWWVDAIALVSGSSQLFAGGTSAAELALEINANPVRAAPLVVMWEPAPSLGTARVEVHSMLGTRVRRAEIPADPGRWDWDLLTDSGSPVANGAYFVVVSRGDGRRMRRRVFVAR
ncbi:MAG TPA: M14 family metallopeptidase [Gemmatimonadales bacterium]|nr:M14 family metallopeptidase [Gemmatimonadales bacterium]